VSGAPIGGGGRDARRRLAELVGAVTARALVDRGASRVALLDDGGPEAELAAGLLAASLGAARVVRVAETGPLLDPLLRLEEGGDPSRAADEARRTLARLVPDAVAAHPANKTALLLGDSLPPEPLLPLGDVWAGEVARLAGGWSAPPAVRAMADAAGGVDRLDAALRARVDGRDPTALEALPAEAAARVRNAFEAGRAGRLYPRIVPKLGARTLFVDLWE
jgi:hypothetical protein